MILFRFKTAGALVDGDRIPKSGHQGEATDDGGEGEGRPGFGLHPIVMQMCSLCKHYSSYKN